MILLLLFAVGPLQAILLTLDIFVFSVTCGDHALIMGILHLNAFHKFSFPAFLNTALGLPVQHIEALLA